jgi:hypothetical protein
MFFSPGGSDGQQEKSKNKPNTNQDGQQPTISNTQRLSPPLLISNLGTAWLDQPTLNPQQTQRPTRAQPSIPTNPISITALTHRNQLKPATILSNLDLIYHPNGDLQIKPHSRSKITEYVLLPH